jgi:hypothetical protein
MRLSHHGSYLPSLACRQLHLSHGVFLVFHEGLEQSLFQKTFAYLLRHATVRWTLSAAMDTAASFRMLHRTPQMGD